MKFKLKLSDKIQRNQNILSSQIDQEIVLFSEDNNAYYGLNATGSMIWDILETPIIVKNLILKMKDDFDESEEVIEKDVLEYLHPLIEKGLILVV